MAKQEQILRGSARFLPLRKWGLRVVGSCAAFFVGLFAATVEANTSETPGFVYQSLYADNRGVVVGVYEGRHADFVLVSGGFDSGFRRGMLCQVSGRETEIAEIILVDVRENSSAALILDLESENVIEPGQSVRVKTVNL